MSRYVNIDGDWVNYAIKAYGPGRYEDDEYAIPIERLYSAPSIDIIRCRECKYWHKNIKGDDGIPIADMCYDFQADDFCSYGSRSEKPNNSTTEDCSMVDCEYYKNPDYQRCMECKRKQSDCPWK